MLPSHIQEKGKEEIKIAPQTLAVLKEWKEEYERLKKLVEDGALLEEGEA